LSASEEKYRHLVELSADSVFVQCKDRIVFNNSAGLKLWCADSPDQIIGRPIWDFLRFEDRRTVQQHYEHIEASQNVMPLIEQDLVRLESSTVSAEISIAPLVYRGKPGVQAIFRNMTKRKQVEDELSKLRKAVETSGKIIFLADREGLITYVGPEFSKVYDFAAEQVV
jgi:PAS domain S-box-containing protein